ncbi:hypothetical protein CMV_021860 [Castanea mollissima]|uniref:Rx N-terminal domain-containing protein n=1 Tax=Castanea mollissima TaxID=60419 RepID=A0A8J4V8P7_9ROSI|nr:hypothetical protein CMV_021860 [Castanea mollissima]
MPIVDLEKPLHHTTPSPNHDATRPTSDPRPTLEKTTTVREIYHQVHRFSKNKFKFSHFQSTMVREVVSSMTGEILSSITGEIVSRLFSSTTELIGDAWSCEDELRGLRESLNMIRAVLNDAERRQVRDESLKLWLQKLEDVAYEVDDVLDEFAYENLRQKIEVGNQRQRKVRDVCSTSNPGLFSLSMANKIKAIHESLVKVDDLANKYGFAKLLLVESVDTNNEMIPNRETNSFLNHSDVIGRQNDVSKIVNLLTIATKHQLSVLPIVGMAVSKSETLFLNEDFGGDISRVRYLSIESNGKVVPRIPSSKDDVRRLRTFVSKYVMHHSTLLNFHCLRVLKLYGMYIKELPNSIGSLIHLRFLSISVLSIEALPKSITKLYNLQTLRIEGCGNVIEHLGDLKQLINLRHIYFPCGFNQTLKDVGQLTCLQTLLFFIVGQDAGYRIEELGCLNQLRGKLDLWNLEHVRDKEEARRANLGEKAKIYKLGFYWMRWGSEGDGNHENDEQVLEGLEPHRYLKSLTVDGFGGKKFPSWMLTSLDAWDGILLFGNLIEIVLRGCRKCEVLPTLGLLPYLRVLTIEGMDDVRRIGTEFYSNYNNGSNGNMLFPALRKLHLIRMTNLVEWTDVMEEPATTTGLMVFRCLEELTIQGCSQLTSAPCHFSSLKKLDIGDMCSTTFENIISKLTTLKSLEIWKISELICLPEKLLQNNTSLLSLMISECADLESIVPHEDVWGFCSSLRSLQIEDCWKLQIQGVPSHLQRLEISGCVNILPTGLQSCTSLTQLKIWSCDNLISIPELRGLHSLIELEIWDCPKLTRLPEGLESLTLLKSLEIGKFYEELDDFPSLVSIEHLHASLQHLQLKGWPKLKSIPDNIQGLTALKILYISGFDGMETLPEWLGNLSSLQTLGIYHCNNLMYLPTAQAMRRLTKLETLDIYFERVGTYWMQGPYFSA